MYIYIYITLCLILSTPEGDSVTAMSPIETYIYVVKYMLIFLCQLHSEFQNEDNPCTVYAISMQWFKEWENFVRARTDGKCTPQPVNHISNPIN